MLIHFLPCGKEQVADRYVTVTCVLLVLTWAFVCVDCRNDM
jgi:hypothetical protein